MNISDFLVIGGGIAGLSFALEASKSGSVTVCVKKNKETTSTSWAQGGIAAVTEDDDREDLHVQDTLVAGAGLCDEELVRSVIKEGPERVKDLIQIGVNFDRVGGSDDSYHLHQEGGHSRRRIYHAADATGREIQTKLIAAVKSNPQITLVEDAHVIDLITTRKILTDSVQTNRVLGAYVLRTDQSPNAIPPKIELFVANSVLVATGGAGKVYLYTSNPDISTGDGIAMCYRAGTRIANMEFFQFHPTCLYNPAAKSYLITEAMRGEGAILTRIDGHRFMPNHHKLAELAPRDIVARAIDHELKACGDDFVLLDIRHRGAEFIRSHFPNIFETCLSYGLDITKEPIPVVPAAHFCCGGVLTNSLGETDIENLYAAGECAYTGLHGANRLASNSLLEGLVFGYRAAKSAASKLKKDWFSDGLISKLPSWNSEGILPSDEQVTISQGWQEIRTFMWNYVGIVRSDKRLARALRRSQLIEREIAEYYWNFYVSENLLELRNLSLVAELIIRSASERRESRGLHYNLDCPMVDNVNPPKPTVLDPNDR